jgi:alkylation response protein AidB-like acyl-CoA dehydrogenase
MLLRSTPALPYPGRGGTWQRFDALAAVGSLNLSVARLLEAHFDAAAILDELTPALRVEPEEVWGVWAAAPPAARLIAERNATGTWTMSGRKAWCSGAAICTHALVTADAADGARLFAVSLDAPGVRPAPSDWSTEALVGTDTRSIDFDEVPATAVGEPGKYVGRPGFWHGAAGVAAVWYGGTLGVGRRLLASGRRNDIGDIGRAHLGGVSAALAAARAVLREAAAAFDDDPLDALGGAAITARAARAVVESSAIEVIERVGRTLGPGPLAAEPEHLRRVADLTLYLRQSHAERDLADLGERLIGSGDAW